MKSWRLGSSTFRDSTKRVSGEPVVATAASARRYNHNSS